MMSYQNLFRKKSITKITRDSMEESATMKRTLTFRDLTAMGIAAVIGAGIFSTIGNTAFHGGPAVIFLFLFTAVACGFSAFCYAEFAAQIPVSGSAYTYAYATLGELIAWIIGWDLLMEYAVGNIAVAISWSDYFTALLDSYGLVIPRFLTMDWLSATRAYDTIQTFIALGFSDPTQWIAQGASPLQIEAYQAYLTAPNFLGFKVILDIPAFLVIVVITWIAYLGIRESKRVANAMVVLKLIVLFLVVAIGAFFVKPENFHPFAPNGVGGILKGVSGVFFAYIGFDAISTTAEECKDPKRDLPRAMVASLIICTILYILVALVLTGVVSYQHLNVGDPLAYVFGKDGANIPWISAIVAVSAVVALFGVLLVFQIGQPRIWMSMSRDGLLPKKFSNLHPKFKTPSFSTIVTGLFVGIPALFMNLTEVTDLTSIGTLCAFLLVSIGVMVLPELRRKSIAEGVALPTKTYLPNISSQKIFPMLSAIALIICIGVFREQTVLYFFKPTFEEFKHGIPLLAYLMGMVYLNYYCIRKNPTLIPVLSTATIGYLMTELGWTNWLRFGGWLVVGLVIYFGYGYRHSKHAA